jgi:hypothetical protein
MIPIRPPTRAQMTKALGGDQQFVLALEALFARVNAPLPSVTATFGTANALKDINISALGLTSTPTGYVVLSHTAAGVVYATDPSDLSAWTKDNIRLRSSAVGTAKVWVF